MQIFVFEEDPSLMKLLTLFLENQGLQVQAFTCPYTCPLYQQDEPVCPASEPCADAVLVNTRLPRQNDVQILIDQSRKGCKLPNLNKAVMSASTSEQQEQFIRGLGFSIIKKPFRLQTVNAWLSECATRLENS